MKNKLLYAFLGFVLCLCMGIGSKLSVAKIQRFKTPLEKQMMIERHEKGLTLEKIHERLTKVELDIAQLKGVK